MYAGQKIHFRSKPQHWRTLNAWKISETKTRHRNAIQQALCDTTLSFLEESSLHGVRNIVDDIRQLGSTHCTKQQKLVNLISLCIWISAGICGAVIAITLMRLVWTRFQSTPTITTVQTNNYPIWNVEFPAITICNKHVVYAPAAEKVTHMLVRHGLPFDRVKQFIGELVKLVVPEHVDDTFEDAQALLSRLNYTTDRLMFELMQPCTTMLSVCMWQGKLLPCKSLFRVTKSVQGFCCSFNYKAPLEALEVDSEHDYVDDQLENPIFRVSGAGQYVGLNVLIQLNTSEYVSYSGASILVHGTQEFPREAALQTVGQPGVEIILGVIPSVVVSEKSVRSLSLEKRGCYFDDEISLRTTRKYTFQSCISECTADAIMKICNCLPFFHSEVRFIRNKRQCTLKDVNCVMKNKHIFASLQPEDKNETVGISCPKCLPSCSGETYLVQTMMGDRINMSNYLPQFQFAGLNLSNYITLKVHFKDISCIQYRRDVFMTWDGLLASFGGIFGLCLGGSVISLVEFFYFFTFKLCNSLCSGFHSSSEAIRQQQQGRPVMRKTINIQTVVGNTMRSHNIVHVGNARGFHETSMELANVNK